MKSVMTHDFSRIPTTAIERSTFDRSHGIKTAFDSGYLVPFYLDEVLPGDTFKLDGTLLAKIFPTVSDFMDNVFIDTQWFFCPSRLLWTNFTKMMGERVNPNDSIDFTIPTITAPTGGFSVGSLADYFGIPTGVAGLEVNALPFRMYAKVWDDWYRDENLQNSIIQSSSDLGDSAGSIAWNTLLRRGKRHDYFTSCLPTPQKGDGVELPLGGLAPVVFGDKAVGQVGTKTFSNQTALVNKEVYAINGYGDASYTDGITLTDKTNWLGQEVDEGQTETLPRSANLVTDLSSATSATINSLRMAFQLQRLLEADNRGGTRYVELIRNHFKTICPDARLQRSEFLGSSSQLIKWDATYNTIGQSSDIDPSVNTFPQGYRVLSSNTFSRSGFVKSFTEHGYIIGLVSVRCDLNYQYGLNRMWSRKGRYDFYWPTLAHLGEQAVLNKEIYAQGPSVKDSSNNVVDDQPFGYQERFAEYRYHPSIITGVLRSQASGSLDFMHLAQKYNSLPVLNDSFIKEQPPLNRVLAATGPQILLDGFIRCICTRPMPVYSVPGLIDHL